MLEHTGYPVGGVPSFRIKIYFYWRRFSVLFSKNKS
ncbi:hypothetical protein [Bacillus pseudomycoides]|nr:hypothetical protein [Bacillus pseudomycoides]